MRFYEFKQIILEGTKGKQADVPKFDGPGYITVGDSHSNGVGGYGKGKIWKAMGMDGAKSTDPMHLSAIERIPPGSVVAISLGANDLAAKTPIPQIVSQVQRVISAAQAKTLQVVYLLPTTTAPNKPKDPKRNELRDALSAAIQVPIVDMGQASAGDTMGVHLDSGRYNSIGASIAGDYKPRAFGAKTDNLGDNPSDKSDDKKSSQDRIKSSVELEQGPPFPAELKDEVSKMQKGLQELGYDVGRLGIDGKYGPTTAAAVAAFKKDYDLKTPSGKFGSDAFDMLAKINSGQVARVATPTKVANIESPNIKGTRERNAAFKEPYFMEKVKQVSANLGVSEKDLLGIMNHESELNPRAVNPMSKAVGLIQFMPKTALGLGSSAEEILKMSATEQMDLVEKYYKRNGIQAGDDIADLYMLTFMPAARNKPDNFVLGNKSGGRVFDLSAAAVYNQNRGFDANGDGIFTVGDVKDRIRKFA